MERDAAMMAVAPATAEPASTAAAAAAAAVASTPSSSSSSSSSLAVAAASSSSSAAVAADGSRGAPPPPRRILRFRANTSALNEDLGRVRYCFIDKTGTLTRNQMTFCCCAIDGYVYLPSRLVAAAARAAAATSRARRASFSNGLLGARAHDGPSGEVLAEAASSPAAVRTLADLKSQIRTGANGANGAAAGGGCGGCGGANGGGRGGCGTPPPRAGVAGGEAVPPQWACAPCEVAVASARPSGCGATRSAVAAVAAAGRRSKWSLCWRWPSATRPSPSSCPPPPPASAAAAAAAAAFQTPSADEAALIHAAAELGISFLKRTASTIEYAKGGAVHSVELLAMSPFTHERKRMSVLVRHASGRHVLYCKGADEVMLSRLASGGSAMYGGGGGGGGGHHDVHELAVMQISTFASQGLRTLVFAMAELDERTAVRWSDRYSAAIASTSSSSDERHALLADLAAEIETGLTFLGVSGVEDTLAPGVQGAVERLAEAEVKMWVVTGDNHETAVTVARAAGLLQDNNSIVSLHGTSLRATRKLVAARYAEVMQWRARHAQLASRPRRTAATPPPRGARGASSR